MVVCSRTPRRRPPRPAPSQPDPIQPIQPNPNPTQPNLSLPYPTLPYPLHPALPFPALPFPVSCSRPRSLGFVFPAMAAAVALPVMVVIAVCDTRHSKSALEVVDLSSYDVCIELDVVRCAFLTPTSLLLSLRGGEVYALRLHLADNGSGGGVGGGGSGGGGGNAPDRVIGQSLRPIGRASPCSVLAVSAGRRDVEIGGGRAGGGGRGGSGGGARSSRGLVFMGSRVGDSLLVKYGVERAGTQPGARGERAVKREPKKEEEEEEEGEEEVVTAWIALSREKCGLIIF